MSNERKGILRLYIISGHFLGEGSCLPMNNSVNNRCRLPLHPLFQIIDFDEGDESVVRPTKQLKAESGIKP